MFEFCPGERRSPSENIVEEHAEFPRVPSGKHHLWSGHELFRTTNAVEIQM